MSREHTVLAVVALTAMITSPPAAAGPAFTTVAAGLDNPRGLAFGPGGALYVAEAGRGGTGPCFDSPEHPMAQACFGTSGAITRINDGAQRRVLTRLPSFADSEGAAAIGPSDISFSGTNEMLISVGLGADPDRREDLPSVGKQTTDGCCGHNP